MPVNVRYAEQRPFRKWMEDRFPGLAERIRNTRWMIKDRFYFHTQGTVFQRFMGAVTLPRHIEIETVNACNNTCAFCPVNKNVDPRPTVRMSEELFDKITAELQALDYDGTLNLFSNNEPFVDKRILDFLDMARDRLPKAFIVIITNGTLLTPEKAVRALERASVMVINNYDRDGKLIPPVAEVVRHIDEQRPDLATKLVVGMRDPGEVLTSRAGNAPNRKVTPPTFRSRCAYPFFQMVIRPDGKLSLCCNDALGEETLGDVSAQSLLEAWNSPERREIHALMAKGRDRIDICAKCDNLGWSRPSRLAKAMKNEHFTWG